MNLLLRSLVAISTIATASAREDELAPEGISPDKRHSVFVEQSDEPYAPIYYAVRDRKTREVLGRFKSSYQPDRDDEGDFAWKQSHPTWIYWRDDGRYLAIDEANHRRMGTVILARRINSTFRQIPVNSEELMRYTKQPWDRGRLFFGTNSFLPRDRAAVAVIGLVKRPHSDTYDERSC
jgi:hypothetical protein